MHHRRTRPTRRTRVAGPVLVEMVEGRMLLSGGATDVTHLAKAPKLSARFAKSKSSPIAVVVRTFGATLPIEPLTGTNPPFSPSQIRAFYGLNTLDATGTAEGAGQTVAIIDAYYSANAFSDLNTFSNQFGLPTMTSGAVTTTGSDTFTAVGESGGALPTATNSGWRGETALDVEWVHSIAPKANILLVEASSQSNSDLYSAINYARSVAGVSVVSMSFGGGDSSGNSSLDGYFTTPSGHAGVTFVASTGDGGSTQTVYPGLSQNVVGVGGTSITLANATGNYGSETAWADGGGTVSSYEPTPTYQGASGANLGYPHRAAPDVSFVADPNTGVYTYDSLDGGYEQVGGTSLSAPSWAGLIAIADQQRATAGLSTYDGATQTLPKLYSIYKSSAYSTDFHDVTTGSNGNAAKAGYDLATGIGTPIANTLVPALANVSTGTVPGTVTGQVFQDNNGNGVLDGTDVPLAGTVVYLDANNDGVREAGEPATSTNAAGMYAFPSVAAGSTGTLRVLSTTLAGGVTVSTPTYTVSSGGTATANLGLFPTVYADAAAGDAWTARLSPTASTTLQVLENGQVLYSAPASLPTTLTFNFTGAGDGLSVDAGNGSPIPAGGIAESGGSSANGDSLEVLGTSGADSFTVDAGDIQFATAGSARRAVTFSNVPNLIVDPRTGTDALTVNAGAVSLPAGTSGSILPRSFSTLTVGAYTELVVTPAATHAGRTVLVVAAGGLEVDSGGAIDLGDGDLIVRSASTAAVAGMLVGGPSTSAALISTAAFYDPTQRTTLGVAAAGDLGLAAFDNQSVAAGDVLVKYTYFGDANLDGQVNGLDYARLDAGSAAALTGWANGDFNFDGKIDGSDYTLIDNAFNTQSGTL